MSPPQTSGGLLVACTSESAPAIVRTIREADYPAARVIGRAKAGPAGVVVA